MNYRFLPDAELELNQTIDYYESCQSGLGNEFNLEILNSLENIIAFPEAWTKVSGELHKILLKRFPYGIIYSIEQDFILIISIMNLHRNPLYLKNRINQTTDK